MPTGFNRVREQGKKLGRPMIGGKVEDAIRQQLEAGHGILKVARIVGVGSGTVQRIKREMTRQFKARRRQQFAQTLVSLENTCQRSVHRCERSIYIRRRRMIQSIPRVLLPRDLPFSPSDFSIICGVAHFVPVHLARKITPRLL